MKRWVLVLLVLAHASDAAAYRFMCRGWKIDGYGQNCPYGHEEEDSCGCETRETAPQWRGGLLDMKVEAQGGNGISTSRFRDAAIEAAAAWSNVSCSNAIINISGTLAANNDARWRDTNNDRHEHGIFFVRDETEWMELTGSGAGGTLGITSSNWQGLGCEDREFSDADIIINGFIQWSWNYSRIRSTLMHEMGHALGLGHPCLTVNPSCSNSCSAVMAASGSDYSVPQQDDANAICDLYPGTPGGLGAACDSNDDCNSGPCITYQGFSYCSQLCGSCPEGYECTSVGGSQVCTRQGAPGIGEACVSICEEGAVCLGSSQGRECYPECNPNVANPNCPGDSRCVTLASGSGACLPAGSQHDGEVCGGEAGPCGDGLVCLIGSDGIGHCFQECDASRPDSCGSDGLCVSYEDNDGYCVEAAQAGQGCVDTNYTCVYGYLCVQGGSDVGYVCYQSCEPGASANCPGGQSCEELVNNSGDVVAGACFPRGDKGEGDLCWSATDCSEGLLCVSSGYAGRCMYECDLNNPSCPLPGQTCEPLAGTDAGVCEPVGGTTGGGDNSCGSDSEQGDSTGTTQTGGSDGSAGGSGCACDVTYYCDPNCSCDVECPCECDKTYACDPNCSCDIECAQGSGCAASPLPHQSTPWSTWVIVLMLGFVVAIRARRTHGKTSKQHVRISRPRGETR